MRGMRRLRDLDEDVGDHGDGCDTAALSGDYVSPRPQARQDELPYQKVYLDLPDGDRDELGRLQHNGHGVPWALAAPGVMAHILSRKSQVAA